MCACVCVLVCTCVCNIAKLFKAQKYIIRGIVVLYVFPLHVKGKKKGPRDLQEIKLLGETQYKQVKRKLRWPGGGYSFCMTSLLFTETIPGKAE